MHRATIKITMLILLIRKIIVSNELRDGRQPPSGSSPALPSNLQSLMHLVFAVNKVRNPKIAVSVERKPRQLHILD
jgi:hypothetical protein